MHCGKNMASSLVSTSITLCLILPMHPSPNTPHTLTSTSEHYISTAIQVIPYHAQKSAIYL